MSVVYKGQTLIVEFGPIKDALGAVVTLTGSQVVCKARRKGEATEVAGVGTVITSSTARGKWSAALTGGWVLGAYYEADGVAILPTADVVPLGSATFRVSELISID